MTFHEILDTVNENDIFSLRGGEPTLLPNLISRFINRAIDKGAYVVLEGNGSFISQSQYDEYLNTFSNNKSKKITFCHQV